MTLINRPIEKCMILKKNTFCLILIFLCSAVLLNSQDSPEPVPKGFHDFIFGDSLEIVKEKLQYDSYFAYRGDPDVSMLLTPEKSIIDTAGSGFIDRAYFIFLEEKLYQITLIMHRDKIDFYTFQTSFMKKYGSPDSLDPSGMIWEDGESRLSLEYPLTVKYIDLNSFNSILSESQINRSNQEILREDFLDSF